VGNFSPKVELPSIGGGPRDPGVGFLCFAASIRLASIFAGGHSGGVHQCQGPLTEGIVWFDRLYRQNRT